MLTSLPRIIDAVIFRHRKVVLILFALATAFFAWQASHLAVDTAYEKQLPQDHPYMKTFLQYQKEFGGANRVVVALSVKQGDIYTPEFFTKLKQVTDEVFFIPGVDRASVTSLYTPNVRFIEIVEDGFSGGNVIPAEFKATPEWLNVVRGNVLKSGQVGRLVAEDFTAALVNIQLLDRDPTTGAKLDYMEVAKRLEAIRAKYGSDTVDIHIIGFAKAMGDVADGTVGVVVFFGIAFVITALLVYVYGRSARMTAVLLALSVVTVIWQAGLLVLMGLAMDPMSILVPFLVFAIAISHGVQNVGTITQEIGKGADAFSAARISFQRLLVPGASALVADAIAFLTIRIVKIQMIQDLALSASVGMVIIVLTHLIILPITLSFLPLGDNYRRRVAHQVDRFDAVWKMFTVFARPKGAIPALLIGLAVFAWAHHESGRRVIGDAEAGVPELWPDSRYNKDADFIAGHFAIGVDIIQVIAEAPANGCIDYHVASQVDDFAWQIRNVEGVQSTLSLPQVMKTVNMGWNEGNLNWRVLPRNSQVLVRTVSPVETSTGLLNADCSVMPVMIFTKDHRAETIDRVVKAVETYNQAHHTSEKDKSPIHFRLATGSVGVMAATNQAVTQAETPMLLWVYGTVLVFCAITFRSVVGTIATVLPLVVVSFLCDALMAELKIGLKTSTLPVTALGVGIGVDYGLYIFNRLQSYLKHGLGFAEAYYKTLQETGSSILFTALTLAVGVATWAFSALKFQANMGELLTFVFIANMLGAIILLPAIAAMLYRLFPRLFEGEVKRAQKRNFVAH
ncbi:MAG: MMPL family transporter [Azospirillaceae bacterium]|nr:MMPL family transporter [Azospirillaceae bacterium]